MIKNLNLKNFFLLIFLVSIFALLSAIYIEFVLNQKPCKLCIYQRIPYVLAIFVSFLGISSKNKYIWLLLIFLIFVFSSLISGYHFGIENNIFKEFSGCTNLNINLLDKSKILESLNNNLPSCKEANFKIFGFSLATLNLFISVIISLYTLKLLINEKNRSE